MEVFLGIPAADGVGIGTAFVIPDPVKRAISQHHIKIDQLNDGWSRFEYASQNVIFELNSYLDSLSRTDPKDKIQREVFETYILMLEDPVFLKETREFYEKELFNIEYSLNFKAEEYAQRLRQSGADHTHRAFRRELHRALEGRLRRVLGDRPGRRCR